MRARVSRLYELARAGAVPAEELPSNLRWQLVAELHAEGWTDAHIAQHTRMTEYTTARIRGAMNLRANGRGKG